MINKKIHNYKIIREIGSGGMATVYEAIHLKLDTKVAIKILNPVLAADNGIRKRFEQEAKIMASLDHEGITRVLDFEEEENRLAIVMEYLEGNTLDEYIKQNGALNEEKAKQIFTKILHAFQYAHDKNIVHRDVKPSNIFITTEGKVKIMDFGIAKIVEDGAKVLTQTGTQIGTPIYMSPEQIKDSKHIDLRTDIYSLGVTLWFMLNGKPPYDVTKDSTFEIFTKIVNNPVPKLSNNIIIDEIIRKATGKKADSRIQNCKTFIELLNNINVNEEVKTENTKIIKNLKSTEREEIQPEENQVKPKLNESKAWEKIKDSTEIEDFVDFRKNFPKGKFQNKAKSAILFNQFSYLYPTINIKKVYNVSINLAYILFVSFYFCLWITDFNFYDTFFEVAHIMYIDIDEIISWNFLLIGIVSLVYIYIITNQTNSLKYSFKNRMRIFYFFITFSGLYSSFTFIYNLVDELIFFDISYFELSWYIVRILNFLLLPYIIFYVNKNKLFTIPKLLKQIKQL